MAFMYIQVRKKESPQEGKMKRLNKERGCVANLKDRAEVNTTARVVKMGHQGKNNTAKITRH